MRNSQKNQILDTLVLLDKAHTALKKAMETGNQETALTLLEQSQDSAIRIGNLIEASEGEDFATIEMLENYCEQLYQTYELISRQQPVNAGKTYKSLRKELIRIENSVKNDIQVRKTVVFLPYKASMWDSLESVWKAADADPECDAYVIPIPYFDKNPDGSFKEEHYEGGQYPQYVPITRYDEYDLAVNRPDEIYIHNPYDEHNHVTSVHPFFYSKNLRNFTDKLVYIPYFVLQEIDPNNQAAIDGMKHFCFTPGTIFADQVIVQSENMRQIYINEYIKAAKEMGLGGEHVDRKFLEKKFLGTGSPKIDKILNTGKEDVEIPAEWLKIIEKPDGSRKKIVFYNTSVSALLHNDEKMLRKMENVFEVFKGNRDEVALLWRPHPLIQATIGSMRPQLWEAYQKIRDRYMEESWGIYDDTADMDRAIVISDAYYGDGSSVVELYKKTGRPLMLQDVRTIEFDEKIELSDALKIDDEVWLLPDYFSRLFVLDTNVNKIIRYYDVPSIRGYGAIRGFSSMAYIDHKIYFIPFLERRILKFDINTEEFAIINLDQKLANNQEELFWGKRTWGNYLFVMGARIPVIIRLNTIDDSIEYITDWVQEAQNIIYDNNGFFFGSQNVLIGDRMFIPFWNANAVLELDCVALATAIHKLGDMGSGYSGICYSEGIMWLTAREHGKVIKWEIETGSVYEVENSGTMNEGNYYIGIVNQHTKKALLPRIAKNQIFSSESEKLSDMEGAYGFLQEDDYTLRYYENISGLLSVVDKNTDETQMIEITVDQDCLDINRILCNKGLVLGENRDINLQQLVEILPSCQF